MNENVYMHAIGDVLIDYENGIKNLRNIVKDGAILSLRNQGKEDWLGFAGLDYISLCDYEKRFMYPIKRPCYNAYYSFIRRGISFAFDKSNIDAIKPIYFDVNLKSHDGFDLMKRMGCCNIRYSDFFDEVQVKDIIKLDYLSYITFPTRAFFCYDESFSRKNKYKSLENKINEIKSILYNYNYNTDIYEIDSGIKMDEYGIKKLVYRK